MKVPGQLVSLRTHHQSALEVFLSEFDADAENVVAVEVGVNALPSIIEKLAL